MIRPSAIQAAALALALAAVNGAWAQNAPPSLTPIRNFQAEPMAWPTGSWAAYKTKFVMPAGRVIDDGNNSISHSEGQGYGMLLAVLANDEVTFNRIWSWTKRELYKRPDGLASWKWEPDKTPNITDPNNASDGDLLIAWALAEASERWSKPDLALEAQRIAEAMDRVNGARSAFGRVLMPGAVGFTAKDREDGPVVNLSYWVFPAFDALGKHTPNIDWAGYRASGLTLLRKARFGTHNLPPEWLSIGGGKATPAKGFPPHFAYNAIRIPLYLAWAGLRDHDRLAPFVALPQAIGTPLREINLETAMRASPMSDPGYAAIFALAACAVNQSPIPHGLRSVSLDRYYSATLHLLSLAVVRLRYAECL